jgi:hypothetical protein
MVTYFSANMLKYGIIFICYFPLSKIFRQFIFRTPEHYSLSKKEEKETCKKEKNKIRQLRRKHKIR